MRQCGEEYVYNISDPKELKNYTFDSSFGEINEYIEGDRDVVFDFDC